MRLEYLKNGSSDCPLIRLYDFIPSEVVQLRSAFASLADGTRTDLELNELPFIHAVAQCKLRLRVTQRDMGISQVAPSFFDCALTTEGWWEMIEKVDPFTEPTVGYQWLNEDQ